MSGVAASLVSDMRAAFRTALLAMPMPTAPVTALTAAGRNLGAPGVDFPALGFKPGSFVLTGLSNNAGPRRVTRVTNGALVFADPLTTQSGTAAVAMARPDFAWENEGYTPVPGVPFIEEVVREIDATNKGIGRAGYELHTILATATLVWPSGQGTVAPESFTGMLKAALKPGTHLVYGENSGTIMKSGPGAPIPQAPWFRCPFTVRLESWTTG